MPQVVHYRDSEPEEVPLRQQWYPVTEAIVVICLVVWLVQIQYRSANSYWMIEHFAFSGRAWSEGYYWTVLTYAFLHSETFTLHIVFNLLMILFVGSEVERVLGSLRYVLLYVASVLSAVGFYLLMGPNVSSITPMIGASGGAFGLLAALAVLYPRHTALVWLLVIPISARVAVVAWTAFAIELICVIGAHIPSFAGYLLPSFAHAAHVGGFVAGLVTTWPFRPRRVQTGRAGLHPLTRSSAPSRDE